MTWCFKIIVGFIILQQLGLVESPLKTACYDASRCKHSYKQKCAANSKNEIRRFWDTCSIHKYNCEHNDDFIVTNMENCAHIKPLAKHLLQPWDRTRPGGDKSVMTTKRVIKRRPYDRKYWCDMSKSCNKTLYCQDEENEFCARDRRLKSYRVFSCNCTMADVNCYFNVNYTWVNRTIERCLEIIAEKTHLGGIDMATTTTTTTTPPPTTTRKTKKTTTTAKTKKTTTTPKTTMTTTTAPTKETEKILRFGFSVDLAYMGQKQLQQQQSEYKETTTKPPLETTYVESEFEFDKEYQNPEQRTKLPSALNISRESDSTEVEEDVEEESLTEEENKVPPKLDQGTMPLSQLKSLTESVTRESKAESQKSEAVSQESEAVYQESEHVSQESEAISQELEAESEAELQSQEENKSTSVPEHQTIPQSELQPPTEPDDVTPPSSELLLREETTQSGIVKSEKKEESVSGEIYKPSPPPEQKTKLSNQIKPQTQLDIVQSEEQAEPSEEDKAITYTKQHSETLSQLIPQTLTETMQSKERKESVSEEKGTTTPNFEQLIKTPSQLTPPTQPVTIESEGEESQEGKTSISEPQTKPQPKPQPEPKPPTEPNDVTTLSSELLLTEETTQADIIQSEHENQSTSIPEHQTKPQSESESPTESDDVTLSSSELLLKEKTTQADIIQSKHENQSTSIPEHQSKPQSASESPTESDDVTLSSSELLLKEETTQADIIQSKHENQSTSIPEYQTKLQSESESPTESDDVTLSSSELLLKEETTQADIIQSEHENKSTSIPKHQIIPQSESEPPTESDDTTPPSRELLLKEETTMQNPEQLKNFKLQLKLKTEPQRESKEIQLKPISNSYMEIVNKLKPFTPEQQLKSSLLSNSYLEIVNKLNLRLGLQQKFESAPKSSPPSNSYQEILKRLNIPFTQEEQLESDNLYPKPYLQQTDPEPIPGLVKVITQIGSPPRIERQMKYLELHSESETGEQQISKPQQQLDLESEKQPKEVELKTEIKPLLFIEKQIEHSNPEPQSKNEQYPTLEHYGDSDIELRRQLGIGIIEKSDEKLVRQSDIEIDGQLRPVVPELRREQELPFHEYYG